MPRPGVVLVRMRRHRGRRWSPSPPAPITYHRCCCRRRRRRRRCRRHHALTLASAVTITAASANVTASPMLLSMVGCDVVCRPSPTALSAVRIYQPPHRAIVDAFAAEPPSPFAYHRQPLSCRSFTEHQSILPLLLMVGCCILRPPSSIPTTSPSRKCFQFSPSWTYFDLLRISTCKWMQNLRGCQFFLSSYVVTTSSVLIPTYI